MVFIDIEVLSQMTINTISIYKSLYANEGCYFGNLKAVCTEEEFKIRINGSKNYHYHCQNPEMNQVC